MWGEYG
ncbi:hypothetical protein EC900091_2021, partial [Escherichia coli 90.0091]